MAHQLLPKEEQTKPEEVCTRGCDVRASSVWTDGLTNQDILYLTPILEQIEKEAKERDDLEAMTVYRRKDKS